MNYFINRDDQQYGPYTLADLQRYTASGNIALTDLCTSEGQSEPVPVAQIIGTIAVPQTFSPISAPGVSLAPTTPILPTPPNLHWALLLLFCLLSCGFFLPIWELVLAAWLRKYEPKSISVFVYIGVLILEVAYITASAASVDESIFRLIYGISFIFGRFNLKSALEEHFNSVDPTGLELNGVMTFFFGGIYFQYHMNDIVRRNKADRLYEMGR